MKAKLATLSAILLFGWAIVRTGSVEQTGDRAKRSSQTPSDRQIKVLAETSEYRLVKHPLGETKVPLTPRRIVSLCGAATDSLAALGVQPVLVEGALKTDGSSPYLADRLKGVAVMRRGGGLNLEVVLAAKPDLIFAGSLQDGKLYGQLSKIAPTVLIASAGDGYRENRILDVGDVVGMSKQARQRLAEYRQDLNRAKQTLAARAKGQPVAFLRFRRNTCVIYTQTAMFGPLLFEQLGLTPDPAMPMVMSSGGWDVLSVERLSTLRAEHIFMVIDTDSEAYLKGVADTPIWRDIPAARHDHVHRVASSTWLSGDGILGCQAIVNDVLAAIAPERSNDAPQ